ncbi:NUDIX hydrolase [Corynebacterium nasicanis]|uniref:NUDIX domain-containing protein n=1 Tax=Corynebacterium nasicanis TaxID=1448267 RepID=A0ABW1Q889_9CORY
MPTPEFILRLREKIGTEELWLPAVTAVVLRDVPPGAPLWEVPSVLLVRRSDNGEWTPVCGICEPGEDPQVTAVREVKEETLLDARVEALLGVGAIGPVEHVNGDITSYMDTTLRLSVVGSDEPAVGDEESTDVGWFSVAQLPPIYPRFRMVIADAVAQMKHPAGFRPRMGYRKRS